jgi:CRP-like cAMP-binding protein
MFGPSTIPALSLVQAEILNNLPGRVVLAKPRQVFREPFSLRDEVVLVLDGVLSIFRDDSQGRRQVVALRYPSEGIVAPECPPAFGLEAIVPTQLRVTPLEEFKALLEKRPELRDLVRRRSERHVAIGYEWIVNHGRRDAVGRVAHLLCETAFRMNAELGPEGLTMPFTQQQVADMTGQTVINVNRVLTHLGKAGVIRRTGRLIEFLDWRELTNIGSFQPTYLS